MLFRSGRDFFLSLGPYRNVIGLFTRVAKDNIGYQGLTSRGRDKRDLTFLKVLVSCQNSSQALSKPGKDGRESLYKVKDTLIVNFFLGFFVL